MHKEVRKTRAEREYATLKKATKIMAPFIEAARARPSARSDRGRADDA